MTSRIVPKRCEIPPKILGGVLGKGGPRPRRRWVSLSHSCLNRSPLACGTRLRHQAAVGMSLRPPREARDHRRISVQEAKDEDPCLVKVDRRKCAKCGTVKLAKCFYRNKWAITGLHHYCRTCEALRQKGYSKSRAAMARVKAAAASAPAAAADRPLTHQEMGERLDRSNCLSEVERPWDVNARRSDDVDIKQRIISTGRRVGTVDDWLADCSPDNPGVKLVRTGGAVKRRFGEMSMILPCLKEPCKPQPLEIEGEPVGPEELFFSWNVDPTNM